MAPRPFLEDQRTPDPLGSPPPGRKRIAARSLWDSDFRPQSQVDLKGLYQTPHIHASLLLPDLHCQSWRTAVIRGIPTGRGCGPWELRHRSCRGRRSLLLIEQQCRNREQVKGGDCSVRRKWGQPHGAHRRTQEAGCSQDRPQWEPWKFMSYFAKDSINWACAKAQFVLSYFELWKIFPILNHWTCSSHTPATSGVHPLGERLASTSSLVQVKSYWKHIRPQLSHQFTFTWSTCKLTSGRNTTMSWARCSSSQQMVCLRLQDQGSFAPNRAFFLLHIFAQSWALATKVSQSPCLLGCSRPYVKPSLQVTAWSKLQGYFAPAEASHCMKQDPGTTIPCSSVMWG